MQLMVQACGYYQSRSSIKRTVSHAPHALQIGCPLSSRRHSGVTVVLQLRQATSREGLGSDGWFWFCRFHSGLWPSSKPGPLCSASAASDWASGVVLGEPPDLRATPVAFATRLLYAGQPSQPLAPPAPLQLPPPGQEPDECSG